jgi:hypothetical protein
MGQKKSLGLHEKNTDYTRLHFVSLMAYHGE